MQFVSHLKYILYQILHFGVLVWMKKNLHLSKPEVHASMQSKAVPILAYPITLITEVHCHCALLPVAVNTQAYQITFYEVLMTKKVP